MLTDFLQYPFLIRAFVGVIILSLLTSILGVFVILRKMSFFGDAIAHSSLAGIALGLLLEINPTIGAVIFSILIALGITFTNRKKILSLDTIIGIFFAGTVAIGVLLIGQLKTLRVDISTFLFGDILAINQNDILIIGLLGIAVLLLAVLSTKPLIQIAFQEDLARVIGVKVTAYEYFFMMLLALVIALGIKVAGIILITPLLIIPAATAKNIAYSFRSLILMSVCFGLFSGILGLLLSYTLNLPAGPTIVLLSSFLFFLTLLLRKIAK